MCITVVTLKHPSQQSQTTNRGLKLHLTVV
uniref:Uncharacterized protein n=1 Tax=Anguilla anguilla TaxID=7936 RepID=A0A0E9TV64_ANGAN